MNMYRDSRPRTREDFEAPAHRFHARAHPAQAVSQRIGLCRIKPPSIVADFDGEIVGGCGETKRNLRCSRMFDDIIQGFLEG